MHLNKVGEKISPKKRYEMKRYLTTKMKLYTMLLGKYGAKVLADF